MVGEKSIAELTWPADERLDPAESAAQLVAATRTWLAALSTGAWRFVSALASAGV